MLLAYSYAESKAIIDDLRDNIFIDEQTRAVFIDFTVYNPNLNLFGAIRLLLEFPASGGIIPSATIRVLDLVRNSLDGDMMMGSVTVMALEFSIVAFVMFFVCKELYLMFKLKSEYWRSFWSLLEVLFMLIFLAVFVIRLNGHYETQKVLDDITEGEGKVYVNCQDVGFWYDQEKNLLAANAFISWFKLFKLLEVWPSLAILTRTISAVCVM